MIDINELLIDINYRSSNIVQGLIFTNQDCNNIIKYCRSMNEEVASVADFKDNEVRKSLVTWIPKNEQTEVIFNLIRKNAQLANNENWKLDLTGFTEPIQFTRYLSDGSHYGWHMDTGNGRTSLRKLSVVIQLSDPNEYEGGDLQIQTEGRITADRVQGNMVIFPSYMQHRVTPVTKGERYSLVIWISGPPLR